MVVNELSQKTLKSRIERKSSNLTMGSSKKPPKGVHAEVLSRRAQVVFEDNKIMVATIEIFSNIFDMAKIDVCPFEKVACEISDPEKSFTKFKRYLKE